MSEGDTINNDEIADLLKNQQLQEEQAKSSTASAPSASAAGKPKNVPPKQGAGGGEVGDDINFLLAQAEDAIASAQRDDDHPDVPASAFTFQDFQGSPPSTEKATIELLRDVELDVKIELGRTNMFLEDVLKLRRGSVVPLDKLAGDPVDIIVNGRLIARGEVLVLNDSFCVRVAELVAGDDMD
jgi:flagellar motor switch protein FliN